MLELFDTIENYINQIIIPLNWLMLVLIIGGGIYFGSSRVLVVERSQNPYRHCTAFRYSSTLDKWPGTSVTPAL